MNHNDNPKFKFVMAALAEASGQETSEFKERIYAEALSDLTIEEIENASWSLIRGRTLSSFPKVGEIREYLHGKADDVAILALDKLEKAMRTWGAYRSIVFDDLIIHAVVRAMGGWPKLCQSPAEEWKFQRQEFLKVYKAFALKQGQVECPPMLAGVEETHNSAHGFTKPAKVVYIGHKEAPKMIGETA